MTVNVVALIESIGKSYQQLVDEKLITYKSPPTGAPGSPVMSLDMAKEGVFLSFRRDGKILKSVTLTIQEDNDPAWVFPNELPQPLTKKMVRSWVHENVGVPTRSSSPKVIMKKEFGWTDLYEHKDRPLAVSMQINYDVNDNVRRVTFLPTAELRW